MTARRAVPRSLLAGLILGAALPAAALPDGAPACTMDIATMPFVMTPSLLTSPNGWSLSGPSTYTGGQSVTIAIANTDPSRQFRGLLLWPTVAGAPVPGTWTLPSGFRNPFGSCPETVTHTNPLAKAQRSFIFAVPAATTGTLSFNAFLVEDCPLISPGCRNRWVQVGSIVVGEALAPEADADGDGIPNGVEASEGTNPQVKDNDVFTSARLFAMQQYRDFLSREGDAGGINYWVNLLGSGTTRVQAIQGFFSSPEFQGVIAPVARLYFANFLRYPDYVGLQFHVARSRTGTALDVIATDFATSPEFVARYGALSNDAFIELVYQNVLGRPSDPVGKAFWLAQMAGGATRGQVMLGFSESPEYIAAIGNEVFITMMYVGMLRRAPDPTGFGFWLTALDGGQSGQGLTQGFLDAPEYRARFLP